MPQWDQMKANPMVPRAETPLEGEAREALAQVCRGEATAHADPTPDEVYAGDVTFKLSNGWTVVVFNDCDEWDYIDHIIAPDGRRIEIPNPVTDDWPRILEHWTPCSGNEFCEHWSGK